MPPPKPPPLGGATPVGGADGADVRPAPVAAGAAPPKPPRVPPPPNVAAAGPPAGKVPSVACPSVWNDQAAGAISSTARAAAMAPERQRGVPGLTSTAAAVMATRTSKGLSHPSSL